MEWFRIYNEARNDAKLDMLNDAEHRVWFRLLCYSAEQPERGTIEGVTSRDMCDIGVTSKKCNLKLAAEVAKGDVELLAQTLEKLVDLEIISWAGMTITFINFKKRQYDKPSDSSEETRRRKAESRARQKAQQQTQSHADVTPEKTVSRDVTRGHALDTDTEVNEEPTGSSPRGQKDPDGFTEFWTAYPKRTNRKAAATEFRKLKPDAALLATILAAVTAQKSGRQWQEGFVPEPARWLKDQRWTDEVSPPRLIPSTPPPIVSIDPTAARRRKLDRLKRREFEGYTEKQTYLGFDGDAKLAAAIADLEAQLAQGAQA